MDDIVRQGGNLPAEFLHVFVFRLNKTQVEKELFLEGYLHRVDVLEEVQKHVDDVTKAEDSSANFQEEAPSMPVGLFNTFFLYNISRPSGCEAIIFRHIPFLSFLHRHLNVQLAILTLHQLDAVNLVGPLVHAHD